MCWSSWSPSSICWTLNTSKLCTNISRSGNTNLLFSTVKICPCLQATIGQLERLAAADSYAGSRTRLYGLVESVSHVSPDTSVVRGGNFS